MTLLKAAVEQQNREFTKVLKLARKFLFKKVFNILSNQRNAGENYLVVWPYPSLNA